LPTRRSFLGFLSALSLPQLFGSRRLTGVLASPSETSAATEQDFTRFVNIAIGTGGHGHTYPGATVPFGMVQLSPDTYNDGWDWCSGYHYSDSSIMGFSHTHLSGTGVGRHARRALNARDRASEDDSGGKGESGRRLPFAFQPC
jgi:putative alpha-1,2-mannosidase